jgi:hypothetical protein
MRRIAFGRERPDVRRNNCDECNRHRDRAARTARPIGDLIAAAIRKETLRGEILRQETPRWTG